MKYVSTILGFCIAGMFVMSVWGAFAGAYGIFGGWFAGLAIIGTMWLMNHYIGILQNPGAFVDMALGIGITGFMRDVFMQGGQLGVDALPTLLIVLAGGIVGGVTAAMIQKHVLAEKEEEKAEA